MPITPGTLPSAPDPQGRIWTEYHELPGLCLTAPQAARLCQIEIAQCERLLTELERTGFLLRIGDRYFRADVWVGAA
jgi:hypothetical protein